MRRSLLVRPFAVTGESGRKINMTIPQVEHRAPLNKISKMDSFNENEDENKHTSRQTRISKMVVHL